MNPSSREALAGYGFILPNFVGFLLPTSLPVLASLLLSFYRWDLLSRPPEFAGLGNFAELIRDARFWQYCCRSWRCSWSGRSSCWRASELGG